MDINTTVISGRLTHKPESRQAGSTTVTELSVATNIWNATKKEEEASYITVNVWGKSGENCVKYLDKGSKVFVQGQLRQDRWEKDGKKMSKVFVNAFNVEFGGVGKKTEGESDGSSAKTSSSKSSSPQDDEENLPF
tara:strand:+ start:691 stop:1098 length:408 start_codon:yes stop_codon:yes gene_type:complete